MTQIPTTADSFNLRPHSTCAFGSAEVPTCYHIPDYLKITGYKPRTTQPTFLFLSKSCSERWFYDRIV